MILSDIQKNTDKFHCKCCDFICSKQSDWNRHIARPKHELNMKMVIEGNVKTPLDNNGNDKKFYCKCGNSYTFTTGLSRHKKLCKMMNTKETSVFTQNIDESFTREANVLTNGLTDSISDISPSHHVDIANQIVGTNQFSNELLYNLLKEIAVSNAKNDELHKQNTEIKNMLLEQNAHLIELANKPSTITNNNTTMNKPKFNLNLFLNEECKNAMNWLEFAELVKSKICFADLEYMGKHGYVAGQSKIIKDNLQNIEVNKRPFHCTDIKRKTVHIKDQDEWKREEGHSTTLTKLVNKIEHTENVVLYDWIQTKPDCYKHNSPDNKTYMDIATAITKHAHGDNQDKALGEVLQNVMVEKS